MTSVPETSPAIPSLARYTHQLVQEDLWKRPGLGARDRSLVTLAALVSRNQSAQLAEYMELALDCGVTPAELAGLITHLAFYSGWQNAVAAAAVAGSVFERRGLRAEVSRSDPAQLLPLDEPAELQREARVEQQFGGVAPGVLQYTTSALFRDLWLHPDLAPRDRSLITVSSLIATGNSAQMGFHLARAMDNGLTLAEAAETFTQLAFYAGWPYVFSALPVAREAFAKRHGTQAAEAP